MKDLVSFGPLPLSFNAMHHLLQFFDKLEIDEICYLLKWCIYVVHMSLICNNKFGGFNRKTRYFIHNSLL